MNKIFKYTNKTIFICIIFLMVLAIFLNKSKIVDYLPIRILYIKSNSMYPTLQKSDLIVIKKCSDYNKDDIVTYEYNSNYLITHRIIEKSEDGYILKGDSNNIQDDKIVNISQIKGKVIFIAKQQVYLFISAFSIIFLLGFIILMKGVKHL